MARKPLVKPTEPEVPAPFEAPAAEHSPVHGVAARYREMTDVQIMEVMHGDPAQMLADIRALCEA